MDLKPFFSHQTKTIKTAGFLLSVSALVSRLLGIVRDWLLAERFGAGPELDIYFAAFKIPDFVYNVLILGGVVVTFLPLFSEYFSQNKDKAWRFSSNCLNTFLLLLIFLSVLFFLFTPSLIDLVAPGFSPEQTRKTVLLTRILFLSPIFFGLSSIFSGILQYFNRFLVYSLCPILYNLGIIFGIIFFSPYWGILGVAVGVILGAFLHFVIQIPSALECGFSYKPVLDIQDKKLKEIFTLMLPRTIGIAAFQVNLLFITAIASTIEEGAISIFNFANNIQYFPVGIIGTSFALAAFPVLSKDWAEGKKIKFTSHFSSIFRQILFLIAPAGVLLFLLRNQVVEVLLRHGEFSSPAARLTSASLALFCFGIFASSLAPLFFRAFFSLKDTKTPTLIAMFSVMINILLSFFLVRILRLPRPGWEMSLWKFFKNSFGLQSTEKISVLALPLAISLSAVLQFILFFRSFNSKIKGLDLREIFYSFLRIVIACGMLFLTARFLFSFVDSHLFLEEEIRAFWQIMVVGSGGLFVYFLTAILLRSPEIKGLGSFLSKIFFLPITRKK